MELFFTISRLMSIQKAGLKRFCRGLAILVFVLCLPLIVVAVRAFSGEPETAKVVEKSEVTEVTEIDVEPVIEDDGTQTKVPIFMYHYVRDMKRKPDVLGWNLSINTADFEKQMKYLSDEGYETIHLEDLPERLVPAKAVVLSFDDATEDFYLTALPILKKYDLVASVAVIASKVGTENYMTEAQIRECIEAGMEVVSHSFDHMNISYFDLAGIRNQVQKSKEFFDDVLDLEVESFVYPAGKYDSRVVKILSEEGFKVGLTTQGGVANLKGTLGTDGRDLLVLPRIRIDNRDGFDGFVQKLKESYVEIAK